MESLGVAAKKIDTLLRAISEMDKFESTNDALSAEELDVVNGGVTMPDYKSFLQYVRERSARERTREE
ncbi:MAG: hypothetical protein FWG14_09405 [Peptococcaceae bacterium]|nr:hypothetical protein [Peptococcaceae bacterium]